MTCKIHGPHCAVCVGELTLEQVPGRGNGVWVKPDQLRITAQVNVEGINLYTEVWAHRLCLSRSDAAEVLGAAVLDAVRALEMSRRGS